MSFPASGRTPVLNGILQSNLDADNKRIEDLRGIAFDSSASTVIGRNKDVYIAYRTDGKSGSGLEIDPLDGSTQPKIDAIFLAYMNAGTTNVNFNLGPGNFNMMGGWGGGWLMESGWAIKGAGINRTTITQIPNPVLPITYNKAVFHWRAATNQRQSVEDLTIDCAYFRNNGATTYAAGNFMGVQVYGQNSYVRNVRVLNGGSFSGGESFQIFVLGGQSGNPAPDGSYIENCEVVSAGPSTTPFALINYRSTEGPPVYARGGRIENNFADGTVQGVSYPMGFDGGISARNTAINIQSYGLFGDTFPSKNIRIYDNYIQSTNNGIWIDTAAGASRFIIHNNHVLAPNSGIALQSVVTDTVVNDNVIEYVGSGNHLGINIGASVAQVVVRNNILDQAHSLANSGTNIFFKSNRSPVGAVLTAFPDTTDAGIVSQATNINTGVTLNAPCGVITTQSASTAALGIESGFTLTNSFINSASVVRFQIVAYSGTQFTNGVPHLVVSAPGSGTIVVKIANLHATNALSGTMKIHFQTL